MNASLITTLLLSLLCWGLAGCNRNHAPQRSSPPQNVILISMDTTRADHLGCYGHPEIKTPSIDRLAAEGVLFTQCTSTVPLTLPSHASMLTGTYPFVHKVRDNGTFQLHPDNLTLTEVLRDAGYVTAAQVGAFVLNHEFGLDQGFAVYRDIEGTADGARAGQKHTEITATQVTDGAIELLRGIGNKPFFLFVHYFDPHGPYEPPQRFAVQYEDAYTAEIAYTDEQIGQLLAELDGLGQADRTLVVLTADHGEGLGWHDEPTHGCFAYDSTLTVPLIFRSPGCLPAGVRVDAQVRLVDIPPTVLSLLGLQSLPDAQGVDLSSLLFGQKQDLGLLAYAETFYLKHTFGFSQLRALRDGHWKYIHAPLPELYDVKNDPRELHNLAESEMQRVREMRAALRKLIEQSPRVVHAEQARYEVDARDLRALTALGYVGGAFGADGQETDDELAMFEPTGPNPADQTAAIRLMAEAVSLVGTGQRQRAERVLRSLLAEAGDRSTTFVWAHVQLANAMLAEGRPEEALKHFESALKARPNDGQLYMCKGDVLRVLGRNEEAIEAFREALRHEPVFAVAHQKLGALLARTGRLPEAIKQYELVIKKNSRQLRAYEKLARLLAQSDRLAEAIDTLDCALSVADETGNVDMARGLEELREQYRQRDAGATTP